MITMQVSTCQYCGKDFEHPKKQKRKYCSPDCAYKQISINQRTRIMLQCAICGKDFETVPSRLAHAKYCSYKCAGQAYSKFRGPANPQWKSVELVCAICGKDFWVKPHRLDTAKYCSKKCYWTALVEVRGEEHPSWKGGPAEITCLSCGKTRLVKKFEVAKGYGKFCSSKCYGLWMAENRTGENCPAWKGGLRSENNRQRNLASYAEWRTAVFERDGFTCQSCGDDKGGDLHAHHIFAFADFPEYRLALWNGITFCTPCHQKKHPNITLMAKPRREGALR